MKTKGIEYMRTTSHLRQRCKLPSPQTLPYGLDHQKAKRQKSKKLKRK